MVLGSVLILSALGLFLHNVQIQNQAADASNALMPQLVDKMQHRQETEPTEETGANLPQPQMKQMPVVQIDGYDYIGFVGIPALQLELPIMADWSYPQLQISPCRFSGDMYTSDLVVMAHNYAGHFGGLQDLRAGDIVTVTDMDGTTVEYEVMALDILEPSAVEEMISGDYDLTLFTCTYGGKTRVTVRCDRTSA